MKFQMVSDLVEKLNDKVRVNLIKNSNTGYDPMARLPHLE